MSWPFNRQFIRSPVTYSGVWPGANTVETFTVSTTLTSSGATALNGATTIGDATTDTCTMTGRLIVRTVNDSGMAATPGTQGEVIFNSDDSLFYGCTVTSITAATWAAMTS